MVNERFEDIAADSQWHVGLHPLADGVRMNVGVHVKGTVNDESFMVRRAFEPYSSTSAIYNGCEEMITQLRRSVDSIFPPDDVDEAIAQDCNQWITHNYWDRSRIRQRFRSFDEQRSRFLFPARR
jgi:hypothetical protein